MSLFYHGLEGTHRSFLGDRQRRFLFPCVVFTIAFFAQLHFTVAQMIVGKTTETQPTAKIWLGGTYSSNVSRTHIDAYSGDVLCGVFSNGNGSHFSLQSQFELPINQSFGFLGNISFRNLSSTFTTTPFQIEHSRDLSTFDTARINRERTFAVSMFDLGLGAGVAFHPFKQITLSTSIGIGFIPAPKYVQSEHLQTTGAVYLENLLSTRTVASGDFSAHRFFVSMQLGAGYDLPVSEAFAFRPFVEAFIPLTSIATISDQSYRTYSLSGGLSLVYSFPSEIPEPVREEPPPILLPKPVAKTEIIKPQAPPKPPLRLAVRAVGLTDNDEEIPQPVLSIENVFITDVSPTLNYMFFEDGASTISPRYHQYSSDQETRTFNTKEFFKLNALGINHELLNTLGQRLQQHPEASITLTGTRSLRSPGDSSMATSIALDRARSISEYLQTLWHIAPSRIHVRSRSLPESSSDDNTQSGQAENRRVEIAASSREILSPVETKRFEQTATPPRIKFYQDIFSASGIKSNKIIIRQGSRVLETIDQLSGNSQHEWLWNISQGSLFKSNDSISWTMEIIDSSGESTAVSGTIKMRSDEHTKIQNKVDSSSADKSLQRFHLLLFEYASSSELGQNANDILNRIANVVTPDASIRIIGHTDITGDPSFNERLSYDRASRASILLSNKLRFLGKATPSLDLEARGSKDIIFDNSVPEGRMLSRTVRVSVERDLR